MNPNLEQYQSDLRELVDRSDKLDAQVKADLIKLIESMRAGIIQRTLEIQNRTQEYGGVEPEWGPYWVSRLAAEYNRVIVQISQKFKEDLTAYTFKSYELGQDVADKGMDFAAPGLKAKLPPRPDWERMRHAAQFPGELITRMSEEQLKILMKNLSLHLSIKDRNGKLRSPGHYINSLSKNINAGPWRSAYARAEVIARTETARIQELGRLQRAHVLHKVFPAVKQYQQWICAPILEWPCKECAQYDGNVYDIDGALYIRAPGKSDGPMPSLPHHVNCRCTAIPWVEDLSPHPGTHNSSASEKAAKSISYVDWDDSLKLWTLKIKNEGGTRSINLPKWATRADIEQAALEELRNAGHGIGNVLEIKRPGEMVGKAPPEKRAIHKALGIKEEESQ